ncbi:Protein of unknown function [Pyronema omphalodes CBS 100304]|uniref:Uncharacterized protein n=1 Tax=Pyronema omphalodes (strain CBS 100304) TaxID=1076935 RepID=U4KU12_PYROM|nr:Protein of unknown function [Pyronema omphalodes CBS 100304]
MRLQRSFRTGGILADLSRPTNKGYFHRSTLRRRRSQRFLNQTRCNLRWQSHHSRRKLRPQRKTSTHPLPQKRPLLPLNPRKTRNAIREALLQTHTSRFRHNLRVA